MKVPAILAAVVLMLSVATPAASADDPDGSGWTYNTGTGEIALSVSNNTSGGRTITGVAFDLGSGTVNDASVSGGSCTHAAHSGSCTFGSPLALGQHAKIYIETPGPKPASVDVTLNKSDASSQPVTAGECPETQFPAQASLPDATAGQAYSQQLADQGGPNPHYFFYGSGVLPPLGLSLSGLLSGTPPAESASTNPYVFLVNVYDGNGCSSFPKYSLKVNDAPSGGGTCTPQISTGKFVTDPVAEDPNDPFNLMDLTDDVVKAGKNEYAAPEGGGIVYAINVYNGAKCPARVTVTDLLPAGFEVDRTEIERRTVSIDFFGALAPDSRSVEGGRTKLTFTVDVPAAVQNPAHTDQEIAGIVVIYIGGSASVGDQVNQAQVGSLSTNPVTLHVTPEPEVSNMEVTDDEVDGDASSGSPGSKRVQADAAAGSPLWRLRKVQVAIQVLTPKRRTKGCVWIKDRRGHVKKTPKVLGSCRPTVWLTARGTRHWALKLKKRLPRARYLVDARAVNRAGVTDNHFSRARHNQRRLTVR
jgi:hypothetical protein